MSKHQARTTEIIWETEDYFLAHLENGGVRFGMFDVCSVDFPATHPEYSRVVALTADLASDFCDEQVAEGRFFVMA